MIRRFALDPNGMDNNQQRVVRQMRGAPQRPCGMAKPRSLQPSASEEQVQVPATRNGVSDQLECKSVAEAICKIETNDRSVEIGRLITTLEI